MNVETMNDEQFDRAVGRAIEQVPVPLGLAERLLATLNSASIVPSADGPLAVALSNRFAAPRNTSHRISNSSKAWRHKGNGRGNPVAEDWSKCYEVREAFRVRRVRRDRH